jgi:hypothetical protein
MSRIAPGLPGGHLKEFFDMNVGVLLASAAAVVVFEFAYLIKNLLTGAF